MLENERLIQLILFGQLELIPLLKKRRELLSRVAQFGVLSPLTLQDALGMLRHRWKTAGGTLPLPFDKDALDLIYRATKGLPRDLIKVSNSALTYAFAHQHKTVNLDGARYALDEHHLDTGEKETYVE